MMKKPAKSSQYTGATQPMSRLVVILLGIYYLVISILLFYILLVVWPSSIGDIERGGCLQLSFFRELFRFSISQEIRLILIVIASGALGSFIHGATSLVSFIGNRTIKKSWAWWYVLRPFIGSALALIFYFVVRGGFFSFSAGVEAISYFGIAATAGLVGMFSKEAIDKLRDVFVTVFRHTDDERADKLKGSK